MIAECIKNALEISYLFSFRASFQFGRSAFARLDAQQSFNARLLDVAGPDSQYGSQPLENFTFPFFQSFRQGQQACHRSAVVGDDQRLAASLGAGDVFGQMVLNFAQGGFASMGSASLGGLVRIVGAGATSGKGAKKSPRRLARDAGFSMGREPAYCRFIKYSSHIPDSFSCTEFCLNRALRLGKSTRSSSWSWL